MSFPPLLARSISTTLLADYRLAVRVAMRVRGAPEQLSPPVEQTVYLLEQARAAG
jgi:hypothetical protein